LDILILDFPVADQEYLAKEKEDLFAIKNDFGLLFCLPSQ